MNNEREIYRALEDVFKYKEFKSKVQKDAVNAVINGMNLWYLLYGFNKMF